MVVGGAFIVASFLASFSTGERRGREVSAAAGNETCASSLRPTNIDIIRGLFSSSSKDQPALPP